MRFDRYSRKFLNLQCGFLLAVVLSIIL